MVSLDYLEMGISCGIRLSNYYNGSNGIVTTYNQPQHLPNDITFQGENIPHSSSECCKSNKVCTGKRVQLHVLTVDEYDESCNK